MNKIVVIGSFETNKNYIYSLVNQDINTCEVVFINEKQENIDEIFLNTHASFFKSSINIKSGNYNSCGDASIFVITGKQDTNTIREIVKNAKENKFDGIYLIATDNVNIDSYFVFSSSLVPTHKVIGIGTMAETNYLNNLVADKLNLNNRCINSYVLGDNDSYIIPWNISNIGVMNINDCLNSDQLKSIEKEFKTNFVNSPYLKGCSLAYLTNVIINDKKEILTVSSYDMETGVYISIPAIVDKCGVRESISVELSKEDTNDVYNAIKNIKSSINL